MIVGIEMWKEQFCKLFCSSDLLTFENIENAMELKYNNLPTLYKYTPFNDYSLNILEKDQLWISSPMSFNDPYDCEYTMNFGKPNNIDFLIKKCKEKLPESEHQNFDKFIDEILKKEYKKIVLDYNKFSKERVFVSCFSEINNSILMWSHYANDHKGICIEFNFNELGIEDIRTRLLFPVIYNNVLFDATRYLKSMKNKGKFNNFMPLCSAINKSKKWSEEKEWRFVSIVHSEPGLIQWLKPKAVYLGTNFRDKYMEKIMKIAKNRNFDVYQMNKTPNYGLESKNIYKSH